MMMPPLRVRSDDQILELGGGANPIVHPKCMGGHDVNVDVRTCFTPDGRQTTDLMADFDEPLLVMSDSFPAVVSRYVIEHLSWRKVRQFVAETFRILKPGGRLLIITADTEAQIEWIKNNGGGWDDKPFFESASCVLFGDQDYKDNTHKNFMSHSVIKDLLAEAGYIDVQSAPFGERKTDLMVMAVKPSAVGPKPTTELTNTPVVEDSQNAVQIDQEENIEAEIPVVHAGCENTTAQRLQLSTTHRERLFDKHYFNGGGKVGGYAREGYWDFPAHEVTAARVLAKNPGSALEIGCARGHVLKRLQDAGVPAHGLEISRHCFMTRAAHDVHLCDVCVTPWRHLLGGRSIAELLPTPIDLAYSIATFEHIPEEFLPGVLGELKAISRRGLHGIDFGGKDDGFDKTHCTLRPKAWWEELFRAHGLEGHEIVDKEELESPPEGFDWPAIFAGDGRLKLNVGSHTVMFHRGWTNIDVGDLTGYAQHYNYKYLRHDVRNGLPFNTGSVHAIYSSHMLEHLPYDDGLRFLKECRRVIRSDGVVRIAVPDAGMLNGAYCADVQDGTNLLGDFAEVSEAVEKATTAAGRLWALLHEGHSSCYDHVTLVGALKAAGFDAWRCGFRMAGPGSGDAGLRVLRETIDMFPCLSLYATAVPASA